MNNELPTKMNLKEAINHSIDYQDEEILKKLKNFHISFEELTNITQEVLQGFEDDYEFITAVNNEAIRYYLENKNKLEEYIEEYDKKYKETKLDSLNEFIKNNDITEISVGDNYGICVDMYERDAKIVIITDEQKETKISYYKLIHEEFK
jgi:transcription termination factor NusB